MDKIYENRAAAMIAKANFTAKLEDLEDEYSAQFYCEDACGYEFYYKDENGKNEILI